MGWSRRQNSSPNDPDAGDANDPLADNMRLGSRRSAGPTRPIGSDPSGSIHDQNTLVESGNFSNRMQARRERQTNPFSTQRLGSWAADPENSRKLMMIGAAVVGFLLLIAFISIASRFYNTGAPTTETPDEASPLASAAIGSIDVGPPASADTGSVPQPATNVPGTDPGQQPAAGSGGAFSVTGTGTEGLFLRQDANSSGQILGTLPEGTRIESLGETVNDGTRNWLKVRTPLGEGWVAQDFLAPAQ